MLYYALVFLLVALVAAVLGFAALAGLAALIAKVLFVVFLILFVLSLARGRRFLEPQGKGDGARDGSCCCVLPTAKKRRNCGTLASHLGGNPV